MPQGLERVPAVASEAVCAIGPVMSALMVLHGGEVGEAVASSQGARRYWQGALSLWLCGQVTAFGAGTQKTFKFSLYFVKQ